MKKASIFVATFGSAERDGWPSPVLAEFLTRMARRDDREIGHQSFTNFRPHDSARNAAARAFLQSGLDWMLMLDNDSGPHESLFEMLDESHDDARIDILVP